MSSEATNRPPLPIRIKARRTIAAYDSGMDSNQRRDHSPMKDTNGFLIIPGFGTYMPQTVS